MTSPDAPVCNDFLKGVCTLQDKVMMVLEVIVVLLQLILTSVPLELCFTVLFVSHLCMLLCL